MSILLIANCSKLGGGIATQVHQLKRKFDSEKIYSEIFNTKKSWFNRLFVMPFQLWKKGASTSIFHIHGCSYAGFYPIILGVLVGTFLNRKILITYHGGDADAFFRRFPRFVSYFFRRANRIIVQSTFLANIFKKLGFDAHVVPNIIEFQPSNGGNRTPVSPRIITTRTLKGIYAVEVAVKAFAIVQKKYPDAILYIVGAGPEERKLRDQVASMSLNNVFFTGRLQNEEVYTYLQKANIWCNPSTKDNMPVSLLEAINAGLAVVSTNVGGIPYMVEHQKSALLVPVNDSKLLANSVIRLIEDQDLAQNIIRNAKSTLSQYSWPQVRNKLLPLYYN